MPHCLTDGQRMVVDLYAAGQELTYEETQKYRTLNNARAWWGESKFKDKDDVLKMLRNTDGRWRGLWDAENKRWGSTDPECVVRLLESHKWSPFGIDEMLLWPIVDKLKEEIEEKNEKKRKRDEAAARKEEKEKEREEAKRLKELKKEEEKRERKLKNSQKQLQTNTQTSTQEEPEICQEDKQSEPEHAQTYIHPKYIEQASKLGLSEEIFRDSATWPFLGPSCSTPIARIERWFQFPHNIVRGHELVLKEDFLDYYSNILEERKRFKELNSSEADAPTVAIEKTEEEIQKTSQKTAERQREGWKALKHERKFGSHAQALQGIIERSKRMTPAPEIIRRNCGYCDTYVIEQFLECACSEKNNSQRCWYVCGECHVIKHDDVARGACRCDLGEE